jgi:photosystem II stability/assembly factor-like uncharacterized protein
MRCAGCLAFLALSVVWMVGQAIAGWELQYEDVQGRMLGEVHFVDEWHGWAIGMEGAILRTTNGGATWEHVDDPWGYGGWAIHFANAAEGWAAGGECGDPQPGYIMHTTDGGDTWELQIDKYDIPFTRFYGLHFVDNQNGWAVIGGKWGRVYHTTNGGAAWARLRDGAAWRPLRGSVDRMGRRGPPVVRLRRRSDLSDDGWGFHLVAAVRDQRHPLV